MLEVKTPEEVLAKLLQKTMATRLLLLRHRLLQ